MSTTFSCRKHSFISAIIELLFVEGGVLCTIIIILFTSICVLSEVCMHSNAHYAALKRLGTCHAKSGQVPIWFRTARSQLGPEIIAATSCQGPCFDCPNQRFLALAGFQQDTGRTSFGRVRPVMAAMSTHMALAAKVGPLDSFYPGPVLARQPISNFSRVPYIYDMHMLYIYTLTYDIYIIIIYDPCIWYILHDNEEPYTLLMIMGGAGHCMSGRGSSLC